MCRLLVAASLLVLVGCGTPAPDEVPPQVTFAPVAEVADPVRIVLPTIGVESTLVPLGLTPERALEVPPVTAPLQAGWFEPGAEPGEDGTAVVVGHVDGVIDGRRGQPGIFHDLDQLVVGDDIEVDREDGSTVRFVVDRTESVDKDAFPTEEVYGPKPQPGLVMVTCGGDFDRAAGSYEQNLIVWAVLAP